jgi:tetratricopeptide (TPR) repeat protein
LLASGDTAGAIDMWQRAKACWPNCTDENESPELLLARLYRDQGEAAQAQMEMKAYCRRTARAFVPRYSLAQFEREAGARDLELRYLQECNRIDPFHRELHVRMGEACEALGQRPQAALEFEMAAAVMPAQDRRYQERGQLAPDAASPEQRQERGALWLRAARLRHGLGDTERAFALLDRVAREATDTEAAADAQALLREWRAK